MTEEELIQEIEDALSFSCALPYNLNQQETKRIIKSHLPTIRWHYLRIIKTLRKDNKNQLWDKPMKEFTKNDYKILEDLENK